jgi:hypothetical protein
MHGVGRALRSREVGGRRTGVQIDDVAFPRKVGDGEADAGTGEIDKHIDLLDVDPLLADGGADIGLVLVVGRDQVDLPALGQQPGILDRHLRGNGRAGAADILIEPRLVAKASDLDDFIEFGLCQCAAGERQARHERQRCD